MKPNYKLIAVGFALLWLMTFILLVAVQLKSQCPDSASLLKWCRDAACAVCLQTVTIG